MDHAELPGDRIAAIGAQSDSQHAHHEAGHAVAAVYRGGTLEEIVLGTADWTRVDDGADTPGWTKHITLPNHRPFVTFAGPWAEAMWMLENGNDDADFNDTFSVAWDDNTDGDTTKYEGIVDQLEQDSRNLGLGPVGRDWEADWMNELEILWPVIREVADALLRGEVISHDMVAEAIERHREKSAN